ncbi:MAG: DUF1801 domain-containing protein [Chitinophagaceae bacterium]
MAELKTKATEQSVESFLDKATNEDVRKDCLAIIKLMKKVTGSKAKMWGPSIIGFGKYHYKYESGHEGDMCLTGFSPRKQNMALYIMASAPGQAELLKKLGKHKATKGCLYIKQLKDVDIAVLEKLISRAVDYVKKKYPDK